MNTQKSIVEMLESVDTSYLSESEKYMAQANAERAEYVADLISSATQSVKAFFSALKANLNPFTIKHA